MSKNTRLNAASVVLFMAAICLVCVGGTHSPWDGTAWDITSPDIDQLIGNHYKEMFDLRKGIAIRMNKEHETLATASAGGVHKQGSARAFFQDAAPTTQVDGTAWDSGDTGSLWFDTNSSPDNLAYVLTDSASTGTWTLLSTSTIAEIVAASHVWAAAQTFSGLITANAGVALGAGDDLVGSATSAINMNAFDVDENGVGTIGTSFDISSTVVVVGTLDDDTMGTATDTTIATSESIKAYVDTTIPIKAWAKFTGRGTAGTATLNGSAGITSIVRQSNAGEYTITFSTAFSDAHYAVTGMASFNGSTIFAMGDKTSFSQTSTTFTIAFANASGTGLDPDFGWIQAAGTQ